MQYFASAPQFYDKTSINERIAMQTRFNELQASMLDYSTMTGVEYTLSHFSYNPSLFIIKKQYRHSSTKVELMGMYYIIEGTIYQAPDMATVLSNRLLTSLYLVKSAFSDFRDQNQFHPTFGHQLREERDAVQAKKNEEESEVNLAEFPNIFKSKKRKIDGGSGQQEVSSVSLDYSLDEAKDGDDEEKEDQESFLSKEPMFKSLENQMAAHEFAYRMDSVIATVKRQIEGIDGAEGGEDFGTMIGTGNIGGLRKGLRIDDLQAAAAARLEQLQLMQQDQKKESALDAAGRLKDKRRKRASVSSLDGGNLGPTRK
ncbi:Mediator of RNA polymerase II transcription subunit 6 [Phlyctochytrium planicorne]|nr:Mediator of RNA polymerase II transcription subunit 6 [Phlyctochytrium planicorne]